MNCLKSRSAAGGERATTHRHDEPIKRGEGLRDLQAYGSRTFYHAQRFTVVNEAMAMSSRKCSGNLFRGIDIVTCFVDSPTQEPDAQPLGGIGADRKENMRRNPNQTGSVGDPLSMIAGRGSDNCTERTTSLCAKDFGQSATQLETRNG